MKKLSENELKNISAGMRALRNVLESVFGVQIGRHHVGRPMPPELVETLERLRMAELDRTSAEGGGDSDFDAVIINILAQLGYR